MTYYFAHDGKNHDTAVDSITHTFSNDWPVILFVSAVAVVVMLTSVYLATKQHVQRPKKADKARSEDE